VMYCVMFTYCRGLTADDVIATLRLWKILNGLLSTATSTETQALDLDTLRRMKGFGYCGLVKHVSYLHSNILRW